MLILLFMKPLYLLISYFSGNVFAVCPLMFLADGISGSSFLCGKTLSWSYLNYYRDSSGNCTFKEIWEEDGLVYTCNAVLNQWLLLCKYK